jgi:hypothetical protein
MAKILGIFFFIGAAFATLLIIFATTIWNNDVEFSPALLLTESWKFLGITMSWSVVWYIIQRRIDKEKKNKYQNTLKKMIIDTKENNNKKKDIENSIFYIRNFISNIFSNCQLSIDESEKLNQLDTDLKSKDCSDALKSLTNKNSRNYITDILDNYLKIE